MVLNFFDSTRRHLSDSIVRATRCVTWPVILYENSPPIASTPPMIASESPSGMSAQQTTTSDINNRGSGLYDRGLANLSFPSDPSIHVGFTTGMKASHAVSYSWKSKVADIIWVTPSNESGGSSDLWMVALPSWSWIVFTSCSTLAK